MQQLFARDYYYYYYYYFASQNFVVISVLPEQRICLAGLTNCCFYTYSMHRIP